MDDFSFSTVGFKDRSVDDALDAIAAVGFTRAEILGQTPHVAPVPTGRELETFRSHLEARGFSQCTVHGPMGRNILGAPEEAWRAEAVKILANYLEFTAAIRATALIIHPVPNPRLVTEPESPETHQRIADATRRSLDKLVPVAQKTGTRILLENLPYLSPLPFLSTKSLRSLVDAYPADALGICIDTGHAWVIRRDPAAEIRVAGPRLLGTHLQDVHYTAPQDHHWPPTHGGLDWDAIRAALAQVGYADNWTFEATNGRNEETIDQIARICREVAETWEVRSEGEGV